MYTIGKMELLNEATRDRLITYAKTFDDLKQFIDNVGYENWQDDFIKNPEAEELTETDIKRIDDVLAQVFNEAHKNN